MNGVPWDLEFEAAAGDELAVDMRFEAGDGRLVVTLTNTSEIRVTPGVLDLTAELDDLAASGWAWLEPGDSSAPPRIQHLQEGDEDEDQSPLSLRSCDVLVLTLPARPSPTLLLGSLQMDRIGVEFTVDVDSDAIVTALRLSYGLGGVVLAVGESIELPPVLIRDGRDPQAMLAEYAAEVAAVMGAKAAARPPGVWQARADATAVARLMASIAEQSLAIDVVCLESEDDGPEDFVALTRPVRDAGYRAGVRLAARGSLADLARRVRDAVDSGCTYVEIQAMGETGDSAPGTGGRGPLRHMLETIREAAGEATVVVDGPFGPAVGLADGVRVSTAAADSTPLLRGWMGAWWCNHVSPIDVAAPSRRQLTGAVLGGGAITISGELPGAGALALECIAAILPPVPGPATADGLGEENAVLAWRKDLGGGRSLVGIINDGDRSAWVATGEHLRAGEVAFDAWEGRTLGKGDILLPAGEAALWQVAGAGGTPRVVGDTGHINYDGLFVRPVSGRVQVRNDRPQRRTIAVEARGQVMEVDLEPGEMRWFD